MPPPSSVEPEDAPDRGWLDPVQVRHWISLVATLELLPAALDTQLKRDAGMNHYEYIVLAALSSRPNRTLGMTHLASFASGSLSRLSHAVGRLEKKGWVLRTPTGIGRNVDVTMTELGIRVMAEVAPGHVAEARRLVIDNLDDDDLAHLGRICRSIIGQIDPEHLTFLDEAISLEVGGGDDADTDHQSPSLRPHPPSPGRLPRGTTPADR